MITARESYEVLAPGYDQYTSANRYEMWLGDVLLPELEKHGLQHGRVLDTGCGTGRSFEPLLRRGWKIVGCDISPAMLNEAQRKFPTIPLFTADLRKLPTLGGFNLVLALNDVVNYLTEGGDLQRALSKMTANLAAGGLILFDSNTLNSFREMYTPGAEPGGTYETTVTTPGVKPHVHRQRHFAEPELRDAIAGAGLELLALVGQRESGASVTLRAGVDEHSDQKIVCVAQPRNAW